MLEALQKSWKRKKKKHVLYWFWCYGHNFIADKKRQTAREKKIEKKKMMMKKMMEKNKALINIDKTARCIQTDMHTQSSYESI